MSEETAALLTHSRAMRIPRSTGRPFSIGEPTLGVEQMGNVRALQLRTWCRAGTGVAEIEIQIPSSDFCAVAEAMVRVNRFATMTAMNEALGRR